MERIEDVKIVVRSDVMRVRRGEVEIVGSMLIQSDEDMKTCFLSDGYVRDRRSRRISCQATENAQTGDNEITLHLAPITLHAHPQSANTRHKFPLLLLLSSLSITMNSQEN